MFSICVHGSGEIDKPMLGNIPKVAKLIMLFLVTPVNSRDHVITLIPANQWDKVKV